MIDRTTAVGGSEQRGFDRLLMRLGTRFRLCNIMPVNSCCAQKLVQSVVLRGSVVQSDETKYTIMLLHSQLALR